MRNKDIVCNSSLFSFKFIEKRREYKENKSANEMKNYKPTQTSVEMVRGKSNRLQRKKGVRWDSSQGHGRVWETMCATRSVLIVKIARQALWCCRPTGTPGASTSLRSIELTLLRTIFITTNVVAEWPHSSMFLYVCFLKNLTFILKTLQFLFRSGNIP